MKKMGNWMEKDKKIIELWYKGYSFSNITNILGVELGYVKRKIIARKVTDRATKEKTFEKHNDIFTEKLLKMWKEEEVKLGK